jgi:serine/threonine protein kinase
MTSSKKTKKKIGKYGIERQIGRGSAANIYLARQEALERKLVIKELLPQHATNEKIISRFKREAKVVSKLSHDAIVHIYDYWVRGNSYYIAMEYVQGKTLREILTTVHHLPMHIAAMILYQICRGLHHAHNLGVIHRDLKPANIILSVSGQVKILDFGIAHFQQDEALTALGAIIGTYNYMSPEQALGKKVTPRSDIFSLGILFYEMITGYKPFRKDEKGDVLEKIVHNRFLAAGRVNPAVPRFFAYILRRCLRKKSQRRFSSAETVKRKLEKYLRRFPLDHQEVLHKYLENLTPHKVGDNWPPKFWRRTGYRLTHLRKRTYAAIAISILLIAGAEYGLISQGVGVGKQWIFIKNFAGTTVEKVRSISNKSMDSQGSPADTTKTKPPESTPKKAAAKNPSKTKK